MERPLFCLACLPIFFHAKHVLARATYSSYIREIKQCDIKTIEQMFPFPCDWWFVRKWRSPGYIVTWDILKIQQFQVDPFFWLGQDQNSTLSQRRKKGSSTDRSTCNRRPLTIIHLVQVIAQYARYIVHKYILLGNTDD